METSLLNEILIERDELVNRLKKLDEQRNTITDRVAIREIDNSRAPLIERYKEITGDHYKSQKYQSTI